MEIASSMLDNEDTIFHYTKISAAIEHILYEKRLKFSRGLDTKDPREYRQWDIEPFLEGTKYADKEFTAQWLEADVKLKQVMSTYRFACFCSNDFSERKNSFDLPDDQTRLFGSDDRLRMWQQYSEDFYGVCIAFSARSIKHRLHEQLGENVIIHAERVHYKRELELHDRSLSNRDANDFMGQDKEEWARQFVWENLKRIFFTKHMDYRDENEYRIVIHDPKDAFELLDITGCIRAVLLGDRSKKVYEKIVKCFCDQQHIGCKRLKWLRGRLRLSDLD